VIVLGRILIGLGIGQFTVTCLLYIGEGGSSSNPRPRFDDVPVHAILFSTCWLRHHSRDRVNLLDCLI